MLLNKAIPIASFGDETAFQEVVTLKYNFKQNYNKIKYATSSRTDALNKMGKLI